MNMSFPAMKSDTYAANVMMRRAILDFINLDDAVICAKLVIINYMHTPLLLKFKIGQVLPEPYAAL